MKTMADKKPFSVNGEDLSDFVTKLSLEPMPDTHRLATYGGTGLILTVEGSYDSDETQRPAEVLQPLRYATASVDIGNADYPYEGEMLVDSFARTSAIAGYVLWSATLYGRRK
jgi:hypothetical protein